MHKKLKSFQMFFLLTLLFVLTPLLGASTPVVPSPVLLVVGTRPEVIKMMPLYESLKKENIPTLLCSTGQHAELLESGLALFGLKPDIDLKIMKPGQDLFHITDAVLLKMKEVYEKEKPALVVVQGDTTSAMVAALAAFYLKIPVAHVEAGLRSGKMQAPFPEEFNRRVITLIATYHFAPTQLSVSKLISEGVSPDQIFLTGNTVVDALFLIRDKINNRQITPTASLVEMIQQQHTLKHRIFLLTAHRRESFDGGLYNIFSAIKTALQSHPDLYVVYPMHPNPAIQKVLHDVELDASQNISIIPPVQYHDLVYLLLNVDGVATDSGGIQEEAVSLNRPVLVLRNETDRPEALADGSAVLVGTEQENILKEIQRLLELESSEPKSQSVYGDGHASQRIVKVIKEHLETSKTP